MKPRFLLGLTAALLSAGAEDALFVGAGDIAEREEEARAPTAP